MLRIAVPNKGMLSEPAWNILSEAGYRLRSNPRQLVVEDPDNEIELFYLRPLDIAVYVRSCIPRRFSSAPRAWTPRTGV